MIPTLDLQSPVGTLLGLLPEVVLSLAVLLVLLVISWRHQGPADSRRAGWLALASLALTGAGLAWLWANAPEDPGMGLMFAADTFRFVTSALILLLSAGSILCSLGYLERERLVAPEYYILLLLAALGMLFMVNAQDLIILFLGLETMSVSIYVLAAYNRGSTYSAEAGLKYFLMGSFASGFLLYGIALTYGAAGSTNLTLVGAQYSLGNLSLMAKLGLGLLLVGFGFKIAAVPFHMWAPDTYDGAPTPVAGFMATAVKTAGFVALARVLYTCFQTSIETWQPILWGIAVASMLLGNLVALAQKSLKRMLAYSSVAHAGYLVAALVPGSALGVSAMTFYLLGYGVTSIAAFALLAAVGRDGERDVTLAEVAGLAGQRPWLAFALAVVLLSLLGFPGTIGFIGKWYIISSLVAAQKSALAVVIVLTSVLSAGYYLPVIMAMYMRPARAPLVFHDSRLARTASVAVAGAVIGILLFGLWPTPALTLSGNAAESLPVAGTTQSVAGN
ncbi:MAG TPA: NADH-quinone oxidoreductase subunit N [Gemmatimonadales bacterium]|nr:NADH-quinone oxidoreductase subunit N [Gemmatimonadales bacterium]